ncbi:hypothetical protein ACYOEI_14755 [Singulisphaera rosea]
MARHPLTMSPNYLAVLRGVRDLHRLTINGQEESPEADTIRDATDAPWEGLTEAERKRLSGLSEDLYSVSDPADATPRPLNPQAQAKLTDAFIARESGQWDRALDLLRRWGNYIPPALLSFLRGSIWLEAGDPATAALFYGHAADLEPDNGNYLALALHTIDLAGSGEAIPQAESVLDHDEAFAPVAVVRACEITMKATQSAPEAKASAVFRRLIPVLERALTRIETDAEDGIDESVYLMATGLLGFSHEFLGDSQTAVHYYSRALGLAPNNVALLTARGILLYGSGPRAIGDFEVAAKHGSPVVWPYFYLAHNDLVSGRFDECRAMSERAGQFPAPDSVRSELAEWKAISQAEVGFPIDMVRASFEEALRLDPSNDRARRNLLLLEAAVHPNQPRAWETRRATAVRTSGIAVRRLGRPLAA